MKSCIENGYPFIQDTDGNYITWSYLDGSRYTNVGLGRNEAGVRDFLKNEYKQGDYAGIELVTDLKLFTEIATAYFARNES